MSMQTHCEELERRHHVRELEIYEAQKHPSCDDLEIIELKRRKGRDRAPAIGHQPTLPRCVPVPVVAKNPHAIAVLSLRLRYQIKRTFRSAAVHGSEMT